MGFVFGLFSGSNYFLVQFGCIICFRSCPRWKYPLDIALGRFRELAERLGYILDGICKQMRMDRKMVQDKTGNIGKTKKRVEKYGSWLALLTWVPFIGDIFALALGFYRTKFYSSAIFMLIGKLSRFVLIIIVFIYFKDKLNWFI